MESKFNELVTIFNTSSSSTDILHEITLILQQQQTTKSLSSFISKSIQSLIILNDWTWQLLSEDFHQWINKQYYEEFFYTFASFIKTIIYHYDNIDVQTKASLIFPKSIDQVNNIFQQMKKTFDNNNLYITIVSLLLDNHSYFFHDNPQYGTSLITDYICQFITRHYVMSKEYKFYLSQLREAQLSKSIFTTKMLFYMTTCSFYLYTYLGVKVHNFSYTVEELLQYISNDYLEIIHIHSHTVESWSKELVGCIAQLIGLIFGYIWWDGEKRTQMKILFPTEQTVCDHVQDLIHIVGHKPFYKEIKSKRSNNETVLMDSTFMLLLVIVQTQNINWFFRSNTTIRDTIVYAAEAALNDEICLCGYGILGEALSNEDLKDLKVADNISDYFFNVVEQAWHDSSKKYKQVPLVYFLRAFQTLSKNDSIQQRAAQLKKISLFIQMCDQYPMVFDIIWGLSFNKDIQRQLRSNSLAMSKIAHLDKAYVDKKLRKIIHGIQWNLEINHDDHSTSEINDEQTFDIMISYSHKDKTLCQQIFDELIKAGYRVWIDFEQMHGNVMDAMAQAIERSPTVIICMSEQYRKSNYCRAEAHYAFQRQRKIIPVLLQKHYKPDGWLLFLMGQLLYVDFIKYEFNRAMKMLFKELKGEDSFESNTLPVYPKEDPPPIVPVTPVIMPKILPSSTISENILEWTEAQVQQWLNEHNLPQMSRLLTNYDGRSLVYLNKYLKNGQTQQILNLIQEDSMKRINESISLIELSRFHSLMDHQRKLNQSIDTNTNKTGVHYF